MFYFTYNHAWNWNKIISAAEGVLKLFQNNFSDNEHVGKYSWAAISLRNNFEIISGKFPRAEIKFYLDRRPWRLRWFWNNYISHVTTALWHNQAHDAPMNRSQFVLGIILRLYCRQSRWCWYNRHCCWLVDWRWTAICYNALHRV